MRQGGVTQGKAWQDVCKSLTSSLARPSLHSCSFLYLLLPDCQFLFFIMKPFQAPELPLLQFSFLIGPRCPHGNDVKPRVSQEPVSPYFAAQPPGNRKRARGQATTNRPGRKVTRQNEGGVEEAVSLSHIKDEHNSAITWVTFSARKYTISEWMNEINDRLWLLKVEVKAHDGAQHSTAQHSRMVAHDWWQLPQRGFRSIHGGF